MFSAAPRKHRSPCVPASSISIKEESSSLVLCCNDRWVQLLQAQRPSQGSCPWSVGSATVSATQTCNGTHLDYKVFCQLEEGEEEEGVRKSMGRKLKSRANCGACFLSMALTAQWSWLCLPLFLSVLTSLAYSDCLFLSGKERRWEKERGGTRKRLVSTAMADEREPDRFCLVAHLFSFSPASVFFQDAPFSFSLSEYIPPFQICTSLVLTCTNSHNICWLLPSAPLWILLHYRNVCFTPIQEEETHSQKGEISSRSHHWLCSFFSKLALPPFYPYLAPTPPPPPHFFHSLLLPQPLGWSFFLHIPL